jgi:hypothetical protein
MPETQNIDTCTSVVRSRTTATWTVGEEPCVLQDIGIAAYAKPS